MNALESVHPEIKILASKNLVGMSVSMSLAENKTFNLFNTFMPRRKEIANAISTDIFDLQIYTSDYFNSFSPTTIFTKWAMKEVSTFEKTPDGMDQFILEEGTYALFLAKNASNDYAIFEYIFTKWLPTSDYILDDRPHLQILDENARQKPDALQQIWIPILLK